MEDDAVSIHAPVRRRDETTAHAVRRGDPHAPVKARLLRLRGPATVSAGFPDPRAREGATRRRIVNGGAGRVSIRTPVKARRHDFPLSVGLVSIHAPVKARGFGVGLPPALYSRFDPARP